MLERGDWSSGSFVASSAVSSKTLTVAATDTLESLKDKINALDYGVSASVLGAGDGHILFFKVTRWKRKH